MIRLDWTILFFVFNDAQHFTKHLADNKFNFYQELSRSNKKQAHLAFPFNKVKAEARQKQSNKTQIKKLVLVSYL